MKASDHINNAITELQRIPGSGKASKALWELMAEISGLESMHEIKTNIEAKNLSDAFTNLSNSTAGLSEATANKLADVMRDFQRNFKTEFTLTGKLIKTNLSVLAAECELKINSIVHNKPLTVAERYVIILEVAFSNSESISDGLCLYNEICNIIYPITLNHCVPDRLQTSLQGGSHVFFKGYDIPFKINIKWPKMAKNLLNDRKQKPLPSIKVLITKGFNKEAWYNNQVGKIFIANFISNNGDAYIGFPGDWSNRIVKKDHFKMVTEGLISFTVNIVNSDKLHVYYQNEKYEVTGDQIDTKYGVYILGTKAIIKHDCNIVAAKYANS